MAVALRRAGPAILASAATVVAALLCLFAADLNSTRSLGGVGAIGVGAGLVVMVTLLLVLVGRWAFWPFVPREGTPVRHAGRGWDRVGAGLVLAATFAVFVGLPVVFLAAMGVLVAVGVLLDTFVVRSLLVPALALDLGRRIWCPGALARQPAAPVPPTAEPLSEPALGPR